MRGEGGGGVPGGGKEKCMVFLRKKSTFQKIGIFHPKRHLGLFWCPFSSSGGACGSLLAPNWVPLAALGAPGLALGMPLGPAGTPPGASSEALGRCCRSFWAPEGVPRQLRASFWGPGNRFSWFFQFPHMGALHVHKLICPRHQGALPIPGCHLHLQRGVLLTGSAAPAVRPSQ